MHYSFEWDAKTADQVYLHELEYLDSINYTPHSMHVYTIT